MRFFTDPCGLAIERALPYDRTGAKQRHFVYRSPFRKRPDLNIKCSYQLAQRPLTK